MFELYTELSKAVDVYNAARIEGEQIEYYEALKELKDKHNEKEIMQLIIELYSEVH